MVLIEGVSDRVNYSAHIVRMCNRRDLLISSREEEEEEEEEADEEEEVGVTWCGNRRTPGCCGAQRTRARFLPLSLSLSAARLR